MIPTLRSRLAGGVWGHLVGDAVGVPYEFRKPSDIGNVHFGARGTHRQPAGTWSDDGALMLAALDSLVSMNDFNIDDQGRRFLDWADNKAYTPDRDGLFDIGSTTRDALKQLREGVHAINSGGRDEHDNGNGSLMRILPVALFCRDLPRDELVQYAEVSGRITHAHRWSQTTCALYAVIVQQLLDGAEPADAIADSLRLLHQDWDVDRPDAAAALSRIQSHTDREGRGFVIDAFWSAWEAFAGASSYQDTIVRAVGYGNDTDTTACIAGGLAGVHWGVEAIPPEWINGMRGHEIVDPLVDALVATVDV